MSAWMNNEWDLIRLQSITLGSWTLDGYSNTVESNELIMKSMTDSDDWLIRSSFSIYIQRSWLQFHLYRQSDIGKWVLLIDFDLDIPSLPSEGIQMGRTFWDVIELHSSSMLVWLIMIEMLILFINSFDKIVINWIAVVPFTDEFILFVHYKYSILSSILFYIDIK